MATISKKFLLVLILIAGFCSIMGASAVAPGPPDCNQPTVVNGYVYWSNGSVVPSSSVTIVTTATTCNLWYDITEITGYYAIPGLDINSRTVSGTAVSGIYDGVNSTFQLGNVLWLDIVLRPLPPILVPVADRHNGTNVPFAWTSGPEGSTPPITYDQFRVDGSWSIETSPITRNLPFGTYTWRVKTCNPIVCSVEATDTFTVYNNPPSEPTLTDLNFTNATSTDLNWTSGTDNDTLPDDAVTDYWQLSDTSDFSSIVDSGSMSTTDGASQSTTVSLTSFTHYFWHVRTCDDTGAANNCSSWAQDDFFTYATPTCPVCPNCTICTGGGRGTTKICEGSFVAPIIVEGVPGQTAVFDVTFTNEGTTIENPVAKLENMPYEYSIDSPNINTISEGQTVTYAVKIYVPNGAANYYGSNFVITSSSDCKFEKSFVLFMSVKEITKIDISAEPKTCEFSDSESQTCGCPKYVSYVKPYELSDYIAEIKNTGTADLKDLTFELAVPEGWQAEGTRTLSSLNAGESAEVTWRVIPPLILEDTTGTFKVTAKANGAVIATEDFSVPLRVPDFEVILEPSLAPDFKNKSEINVITIINNKKSAATFEKPSVEYNINVCDKPETKILDLFEFEDVAPGQAFVYNKTYSLPENLGEGIYSVHGVLYSKGNFADQSLRTLDLSERVPVHKVFAISTAVSVTVTVAIIAGIAIAYYLIRFRKKENGVRVRV
jgi:hypothetical protein